MAASPTPRMSVYDSVRLPLGYTMCIRVIKIRPSTLRDFSDPIVCDFSILDVDNGVLLSGREASQQSKHRVHISAQATKRAEYVALSYTWGDTPEDQMIELDGTPFAVRESLWEFLYRARVNRITGYLWVDAICINQNTLGERNHQVGMMGAIYSKAEYVIVWLGNCSYHEALKLFGLQGWREENGDLNSTDDYHTMSDLMYLPYWSRAWIVQEYHLARRKYIWRGGFRFSQQDLKKLERYGMRYDPISPAGRLWCGLALLDSTHSERNALELGTFSRLLDTFLDLKCTEKRDHIFGLLPLLTPEERSEIGIYPDYSTSTTSLFVDVFTRLTNELRNDKSLQRLTHFEILEHMLAPDIQNPSVQSAHSRPSQHALFTSVMRMSHQRGKISINTGQIIAAMDPLNQLSTTSRT